jgi:hypothetical protein
MQDETEFCLVVLRGVQIQQCKISVSRLHGQNSQSFFARLPFTWLPLQAKPCKIHHPNPKQ